jgi:hypothetical protein
MFEASYILPWGHVLFARQQRFNRRCRKPIHNSSRWTLEKSLRGHIFVQMLGGSRSFKLTR